MKRRLLDLLCCPHDKARFEVHADVSDGGEILEGWLSCSAGHRYPIVRSIPRIIDGIARESLEQNYAASFGFQWTQFAWEDPESNLREFWKTTDFDERELKGKLFLDAGCGGGRTTAHLPRLVKEIVYLDYSVAVEKVHQKCAHYPNAHFVQASVAAPPLRNETFDIVFCSGVLHHTPDTYRSFCGLPPVVKLGGYLHIYVFRKSDWPVRIFHLSDHALRAVVSRLPREQAILFCRGIGLLATTKLSSWLKPYLWFSLKPDSEVRLTHNHDWYACRFHHEHTLNEVIGWFVKHGFERIGYINGWPEAPEVERYEIPRWVKSQRLGLSMTVHGTKRSAERRSDAEAAQREPSAPTSIAERR
jgi:SAM-dependent methyltransferase